MIEIPKSGQLTESIEATPGNTPVADPSDVHAMSQLMRADASANTLSCLFSGRMVPKRSGRIDPEARLRALAEKHNAILSRQDSNDSDQESPDTSDHDSQSEAEALAQEVADQILVSDPEYRDENAGQEVRIKIKAHILKDAHIHLTRTPERLNVRLITGELNSVRVLEQSANALEAQLRKNFTGRIDIKTIYLDPEDIHG